MNTVTAPHAADLVTGYIGAGVEVLPLHTMKNGGCTCLRTCPSPAKHPITEHGKDDATTDPTTVAEWLARYPGCNWGARPPIDCIVVDVDPRNGGDSSLDDLQNKHGHLPPTRTARTGSGGLHIWFSYRGPARGKLAKGIDIKTNSGYVVMPPSRHASGGTYEWTTELPPAYAPQWLKDIINPPVVHRAPRPPRGDIGDKRIAGLVEFVASRTYGEVNDALYWAACQADELDALDDILEQLVDAARHAAGGKATAAGEAQTRRSIESARGRPKTGRRISRATSVFMGSRAAG